MNASLQAVYIHHVVRDMTYHIELSAVNRIGEGVRSKSIVVGMLTHSIIIIMLLLLLIAKTTTATILAYFCFENLPFTIQMIAQ